MNLIGLNRPLDQLRSRRKILLIVWRMRTITDQGEKQPCHDPSDGSLDAAPESFNLVIIESVTEVAIMFARSPVFTH